MGTWIDFRQLREKLDFAAVLRHYGVQFKRRGSQAIGRCPLPNHKGLTTSPSFSVSLEKRIFQCFGCSATGNVLDFICYMERLDPRNPQEFRKGAVLAQERFAPQPQRVPPPMVPHREHPPQNRQSPPPPPQQQNLPVAVNEPLDFALKNLDTKPAYLLNRAFTEETIAHFGLGLCTKGTFAGRIVIPLHDQQGRLIGYAGRIVFDEAVDAQNPKYLFPGKRERSGRILEFAKSLFVYNGYTIQAPVHDLVIVQGFPAAWWLWQCGHRDVVALMGSSCSVDQGKIIIDLVSMSGRVWFLTDADKAGEKCAHSLFTEVGTHRFCCWLKLSAGQPTDCSSDELRAMLEWKIEV